MSYVSSIDLAIMLQNGVPDKEADYMTGLLGTSQRRPLKQSHNQYSDRTRSHFGPHHYPHQHSKNQPLQLPSFYPNCGIVFILCGKLCNDEEKRKRRAWATVWQNVSSCHSGGDELYKKNIPDTPLVFL